MERIGKEVERSLASTGGGAGLALTEITAAWPAAVGEPIARNAWPLRLGRDGTLHVATSSATWAFELDRMSPELADRLGALLGESAPAGLRFRPGPVPESGPEHGESSAAPEGLERPDESTPEVAREASAAAASIEDPELRELVARAARASLRTTLPGGRSGRGFW
jgi:hypothetical protein